MEKLSTWRKSQAPGPSDPAPSSFALIITICHPLWPKIQVASISFWSFLPNLFDQNVLKHVVIFSKITNHFCISNIDWFWFFDQQKDWFSLMFPVQFGGSSLSSQVWSITIHAINSIINHLYFAISEFCKMWSWLGFPRSILRDTVPTLILAQPFEHGWQTALDSSTLPFTPVAARMLYLSWNPGSEQVPDGFPTADSTLISLPPGPPGPPGGQHCSTLSQRWRNRPRVFAGKAQKVNCAPQRCHVGRSCRENKSVTFWNSGSSSYREDLVGTDKKELKKVQWTESLSWYISWTHSYTS